MNNKNKQRADSLISDSGIATIPEQAVRPFEKQCSKCKEVKPLADFNTRPDRSSGYRSECKKCQYDSHMKRYFRKIAIMGAKYLVDKAYSKGLIIKPPFCEQCEEDKPLDKHHSDYSNPLEIIWLCRKCHTRLHAQQGAYNHKEINPMPAFYEVKK